MKCPHPQKVEYRTRGDARRASSALLWRGHSITHPYYCRTGRHWHLTTTKPRRAT